MSAAAAAFALADRHSVEIALDSRGDLVFRSRGFIRPDVLAALRQARGEMLAALRHAEPERALSGDELLEALRVHGFVINLTGSDRDLRDIVAERRPLFERLLSWRAPTRQAFHTREAER